MKKFILGVIVGALLMFSSQIYAETTSLLGTKVDRVMHVQLGDKEIGDAPVIQGTSYLPVRDMANELGLNVAVTGDDIQLTQLTGEANAQKAAEDQAKTDAYNAKMNPLKIKKMHIEQDIEHANKSISNLTAGLGKFDGTQMEESFRSDTNKLIADYQAKITAWQAELVEVNAQIAALEAQQ